MKDLVGPEMLTKKVATLVSVCKIPLKPGKATEDAGEGPRKAGRRNIEEAYLTSAPFGVFVDWLARAITDPAFAKAQREQRPFTKPQVSEEDQIRVHQHIRVASAPCALFRTWQGSDAHIKKRGESMASLLQLEGDDKLKFVANWVGGDDPVLVRRKEQLLKGGGSVHQAALLDESPNFGHFFVLPDQELVEVKMINADILDKKLKLPKKSYRLVYMDIPWNKLQTSWDVVDFTKEMVTYIIIFVLSI